jgi:CubicO group peptidase (beta-lactamase class C family)
VADEARLRSAVTAAIEDETPLPRAMVEWLETTLAAEPWPHIMGDVADRAGPTGVVWHAGRELIAFGEPDRIDMCFSIAKSALATVAGVAYDDGLLGDLDEPAGKRSGIPELAGSPITWRHLLTQTSDWRGELFGIPWWGDPQGRQEPDEPEHEPGSRFAYNDVRTNLLSLALTHVHGRALGDVLRERIMEPIGAGPGWSWRGLHQMRTLGDVPVVTGGSHWGGGLWATARDLVRYGRLHLNDGEWEGRRLLSREWCRMIREPTPARPAYGLMWWIGEDGAFSAQGTGEQYVWCDPQRDLVVVVRWVVHPETFVAAVSEAVDS